MAASLNDYLDSYNQACTAYAQQKYEVAATLVDEVVQNVPDDANCHLLRGHIYYVLQQYDVAQQEYEKVLQLSDDQEIVGFANNGLESINQYQQASESDIGTEAIHQLETINIIEISDHLKSDIPELEDLGMFADLNSNSFELDALEELQSSIDVPEQLSSSNPFEMPSDSISFNQTSDSTASLSADPFALNQNQSGTESHAHRENEQVELDLPVFWQEEMAVENVDAPENSSNLADTATEYSQENPLIYDQNVKDTTFAEVDFSMSNSLETTP
ncbi:MAG: methyl-accepting chemotaxis protein, partial [Nodularia sp. (in: cyanobacteria)]|nr:methyl-accepting chemotaxis protein [Nodularia sp. (in: cyanobacteria)]